MLFANWPPPILGVIKVNCDASFDSISGEARVGARDRARIRDHLGAITTGDSTRFKALSTLVVETFDVRIDVCLAIEACL
ncbi:hypothetical protein V6N12_013632 [Hibiscus sabdariffa]|uniref:RNase H type-1 domain-containing protein n=1 Tax=Hibiscus sabdariffa TaxID=183260 RepID=A0ABR2CAE9_9ROSI